MAIVIIVVVFDLIALLVCTISPAISPARICFTHAELDLVVSTLIPAVRRLDTDMPAVHG
ncbi:hypothetical protein CYLTODRAFT_425129 [Cylindrobasidium torrendii FP15055 ss-10]|uniref:Uncharacterized protein n=1 Tax=Cylindrobasidium torrendii FP15055 ss-10 TaxID=1314674 RepID=A0A0D7B1P2_9AGAR|nr:hypothetical protein CYLTODRAFT_425129 [Cylindrobasidium torrendii FP15055 ss-10]